MEAVAAELAAMREKIEKLERARQLSPKLATRITTAPGVAPPPSGVAAAAMQANIAAPMDEDDEWWENEEEEEEEEVSWEKTYNSSRVSPKTLGDRPWPPFWRVPLPSPSSNPTPSLLPPSLASQKLQLPASIGPTSRSTHHSES